jgi:hypothetical protein
MTIRLTLLPGRDPSYGKLQYYSLSRTVLCQNRGIYGIAKGINPSPQQVLR